MNRDELNKRRDELAANKLEHWKKSFAEGFWPVHKLTDKVLYDGPLIELIQIGFNSATEILMPEIEDLKAMNKFLKTELEATSNVLANRSEQLSKAREVLEVVVKRGDEYGHDARKLGIPLGIYCVCKDTLEELEQHGEKSDG